MENLDVWRPDLLFHLQGTAQFRASPLPSPLPSPRRPTVLNLRPESSLELRSKYGTSAPLSKSLHWLKMTVHSLPADHCSLRAVGNFGDEARREIHIVDENFTLSAIVKPFPSFVH